MAEIRISCDVCGTSRGEGNHWLLMDAAETSTGPLFMEWSDDLAPYRGHICSAACAHLVLDRWLTMAHTRSHDMGGE